MPVRYRPSVVVHQGLDFIRRMETYVSLEAPKADADRSHIFVVRVWFEAGGEQEGDGEWRGEVRDVATSSIVHFRYLEGLTPAVRALGLTGR